ncbi:hypothetical protein WMF31_00290 [Sorangium sp. So ce1036]|uniref:hypothetical protein n=1 Tax=Sorangium sp. So ce1036 TaxID=3133328 RepID=UPI003F0DEB4F
MSSSAAELHGVAPGLALRLALPAGARDVPEEALPAIDVSALAGAAVTLRRGVEADGLSLRAVCVTAPSRHWAIGLEELVLDRASGLVHGALGVTIERWEARPIRAVSHRFEQPFEGTARAGERALALHGRHVLGFAGSERDAALCSVVCLEPAQGAPRCGALLAAAELEGAFVAPPEPDLLVRTIFLAADQPLAVAAALGALAAAAVAVLLARRPRPRP